jgi:uncharacterized protein (TIGR03435 family)
MQFRSALLCVLAVMSAGAQTAAPPAFETASIKLSPPDAGRPSMISNPGRWSCANCTLYSLLTHAFTAMDYQIVAPDWTYSVKFDVAAKLPEGATREELKLMVHSLLRERLHLQSHSENREKPVYELVVAEGGPKIKRVTEPAPPPAPGPEVDANGYPNVPNGTGMRFSNGRGRIQFRGTSMKVLANYLSGPSGRPVVDATGLEGDYALTLSFALPRNDGSLPAAQDADSGPTIFEAVERQLGLKLKPAKRPVEVFVIDRIDRTPVEN